MKIKETTNPERRFRLDVSEDELRFIKRGLLKDTTNDDENYCLFYDVEDFMRENGIDD